jgi:hypothetical protein
MNPQLTIAIEEIDALTHELLGEKGKYSTPYGDAAIKLLEARSRILSRCEALIEQPFTILPSVPTLPL